MISILINIFTVVLILVAVFLGLVVLAQRAKSDAGLSSGMGGGMMESAFGPDTSNVLSRLTIKAMVAFFVLSFLIYLGYIYQRAHPATAKEALPTIAAPATLPAAGPTAVTPARASAPAVSLPTPPAPNAAKTTTQSGTPAKSP
jgi:preprotein translocase subunit SecG